MYQRNGKWYSDFWYEGRRYTKGWGSISKSVAKEKERKFRNEIASGRYESKKAMVEFETFVVKYLREKKLHCKQTGYDYYLQSTVPLVEFFRGKKLVVRSGKEGDSYEFIKIDGSREKIRFLSEIHPLMIQDFKRVRKSAKIKGAGREITGCTVNKSLKVLSNMFRLAKKWKMAKENPVEEIVRFKEKPDDAVVLTKEREVEFFRAVLGSHKRRHLKAIATIALYTGRRLREVLNLKKAAVNLREREVSFIDTKNGETILVPLTELLLNELQEAIDKSPKGNPYVFPNPKTGKPFTDIRRSLQTAMKEAGFEHYKFHWLRHSFCSRMAEEGIDRDTIMEVGGWKSDSMVSRYNHPSKEHKRRSIEKIQNTVPLILPLGKKKAPTGNL